MPVNRSEQKVRVTKLYGACAAVGLLSPAVNMKVRYGTDARWITSLDSGNFQVSLALTSGGAVVAKAYPHDLTIDTPSASGWGWPTIAGSVTFGHSGVFPAGIPSVPASGMVFEGGDSLVHTFYR